MTILTLLCGVILADEYRYELFATTGLQERAFDIEGKATTIVFSKKSNAEAQFVLSKILNLGVSGTKDRTLRKGVPFEQAIMVRGKLDATVLRTTETPITAGAENYQIFTLEELAIQFPLMIIRAGKVFDTFYIETHFSFETLFPDGLEFAGEKVDLLKYTAEY